MGAKLLGGTLAGAPPVELAPGCVEVVGSTPVRRTGVVPEVGCSDGGWAAGVGGLKAPAFGDFAVSSAFMNSP